MSSRWLYIQVHGRKPARSAPIARRQTGPARSWKYKAWIRSLPCAACGTTIGVEAAHTGSDGGAAQKASDYSCIPLCADCHTAGSRAYHGLGSSAVDFERRNGLDFRQLVKRLNHDWFAYSGLVK